MRFLTPTLLALALALALPATAAPQAGDEPLLLDLCVNQSCKGIAVVIVRGDQVWVERGAATSAGLQVERLPTEHIEGRDYVRVDAIGDGTQAAVDRTLLRLDLSIPSAALPPQRVTRSQQAVSDRGTQVWSGFVNYAFDLGQGQERSLNLDGAFGRGDAALRSTGRWLPGTAWQRGLTRIEIDQPVAMRRWTIGDQFAVSRDPLGGGLLMGGVGVERAFDTDPFLITAPKPFYNGVLDSAGTVEVYANGVLIARRDLQAGPFTFEGLGVPPGRSDVEVVFRDPFGNRRELASSSYYGGSNLLARGLSEYALHVGAPRANEFGGGYDDDVALQGWYRRGLSDWFTLGGRVEANRHLRSVGTEAALRAPVGEFAFSYASSHDDNIGNGHALAASYSYSSRHVGFSIGERRFDENYRNLGDPFSDELAGLLGIGRLRGDAYANVSASINERLSLQFNAGRLRRDDAPVERNLGVSGSYRLGARSQLLFGVQRRDDGEVRDTSALLSVNIFLGRDSLTVGAGHDASGTTYNLDARRSRPADTGFGYDLNVQQREGSFGGFAEAQYEGVHGRAALQAERFGDSGTQGRLLLSGALLGIGGRVFATPPVDTGFALVRLGDVDGVEILRENVPVGRTDAHGDFLVRNVEPFYPVKLSLDPQTVPIDYRIDQVERKVTSARNTGALVQLPVHRLHAVTGNFVDASGAALHYGDLSMQVGDTTIHAPIGGDGRFYFEDLVPGRYDATIDSAGVQLRCTLLVPASGDASASIRQLGAQACIATGNSP